MNAIFGSSLEKLKSEVESLRLDGAWLEITGKTRDFSGPPDGLIQFFQAEAELEIECDSLLDTDFSEKSGLNGTATAESASSVGQNETRATEDRENLLTPSELMENFLIENDESTDIIYKQLAFILLAKLHYLTSDAVKAMECLLNSDLDLIQLSDETNARTLRIVAEGLAVKARCTEILGQAQDSSMASRFEGQQRWSQYEIAVLVALQARSQSPSDLVGSDLVPDSQASEFAAVLERLFLSCIDTKSPFSRTSSNHRVPEPTHCFLVFIKFSALRILRIILASLIGEEFGKSIKTLDASGKKTALDLVAALDAEYVSHKDQAQICLDWMTEELTSGQTATSAFPREMSLRCSVLVLYLWSDVFLRLNHHDLLESAWSRIMSHCWNIPALLLKYSQLLVQLDKSGTALVVLQNLIRMDSKNFGGLILACRICAESCEYSQLLMAVKFGEQALDAAKEETERYAVSLLLATVFAQLCFFEDNSKWQEKANHHFAAASVIALSSADLIFNTALHQAHQQMIHEAITGTEKYLEIHRNSPDAWHLYCLLLTAQGHNTEALECLDKHFTDDVESSWEFVQTKLLLLERMGQVNEALQEVNDFLERIPAMESSHWLNESSLDFEDDPAMPEAVNGDGLRSDMFPLLESPTRQLGRADSEKNGSSEDLPVDSGVSVSDGAELPEKSSENSTVSETDPKSGATVTTTETVSVEVTVKAELVENGENAQPGLVYRVLDSVVGALGMGSTVVKEAGEGGSVISESQELAKSMILDSPIDDPEQEIKSMTGVMNTVYEKIVQVVPFAGAIDEQAELAELKSEMENWTRKPSNGGLKRCTLLAWIARLQLQLNAVEDAENSLLTARDMMIQCHFVEYTDGLLALRQGDPARAKSAFELALTSEPTHLPAWLGLLDLAVVDGNSGLIQGYLEQMKKFCPDEPIVWLLCGQFLTEFWGDDRGLPMVETAQRRMAHRPVRSFRVINFKFPDVL